MTTAPVDAWEALHAAHVNITRQVQGRPEVRPITLSEYHVLHTLSRAGQEGMRFNRLNDHVPLSQSALSRMVERLEHRDILHRWPDPDDARGVRVRLTNEGRQVHDNITTRHHQHITELLETALTPDELTTLTTLLTKLTP